MNKRIYLVNRETGKRESYEPRFGAIMAAFWAARGFEEVSRPEYLAFGKEHAGPRTAIVYLSDEQNTKLSAALKRLQAGKHPHTTMNGLLESIIALYVKEHLS